jgi:2-dehydropantoate 2-reductase
MAMSNPIVVWGAGAIGGTIGAHLLRAGHDVLFVDRVREHVAAINAAGLKIIGPVREFVASARAVTPDAVHGTFDTVLLCVKAQDTEAAAHAITPHLAADGCVVSVQNGLNETVIAGVVGTARTVGAFVNFGADYMEPGLVQYSGRGAVVVGEINGLITPRAQRLHALLLQFDDRAVLTSNIWGYLWGKLAYGAMLFATALTNESIADCLASPSHRPLFIALAQEVLAVADRAGIKPEPFDGFNPGAYGSDDGAARSLDALVEHNRRSAKSHSGIWRDLAVRKRKTEADPQLGPIVTTARQHRLDAPITARLIAMIHEIEEGSRAMAWTNLNELAKLIPA